MSKKQHKKQVQQARERRRQQAFARKQRRQKIIILVMVVLMVLSLVAVGLSGLFADDGGTPDIDALDDAGSVDEDGPDAGAGELAAEDACPPADDVAPPAAEIYDEPPRTEIDADATYRVNFETSCGAFEAALDVEGAPRAVENLVALAEDGYYEGVIFHRVIQGFVIQAGDPAGTGCGQPDCADFDPDEPSYPGFTIPDETSAAAGFEAGPQGGVLYPRGTLAMARTGAPDSTGAQFFVVQGDPIELPGDEYIVVGTVTDGMEVVDRIAGQPTGPQDRPVADIAIVTVAVSTG